MTLAAVTLAGIALSPLVARCAPVRRDRWTRRWCRALARVMGVRVRISGAVVPAGGVLLVANHVSWLDIPLLAAVRPGRMLAKTEVGNWPVVGRLAGRGGTLFIDRDRLRALPGTVVRIASALRDGGAVVAFPEGSTWCGREHGPFRRAVFQAALDADVPVQPVRIRYVARDGRPSTAPAFVGDDTFGASLWRVAMARGLVAEVRVQPALSPAGHSHRRELARAAQAAVTGGEAPGRAGACPPLTVPHPAPGIPSAAP